VAELVWKKLAYDTKKAVPDTAYHYKTVDGKFIYKDRYADEFYVVYRHGMGYIVEKYRGECKC
jgi:hypothetical protein